MTRIFPHPNLTLEVPLVEIAEYRRPGMARRRWRRDGDHVVEDQTWSRFTIRAICGRWPITWIN